MPKATKIYNGGDVKTIGVKQIFDSSVGQIKKRLNTPVPENVDSDSDVYNFQHPVRGFGIVICIENFPLARLSSRPYAQDELQSMNEMLTKLEFQVLLFTDLTVQQIVDVLTEAASRKEVHKNADTFACVIGTHGNELEVQKVTKDKKKDKCQKQHFHHVVYGTDGPVLTSDLISLFEDNKCPDLKGKPRMFFLQACRSRFVDGEKGDMGVEINVFKNLPETKPLKSHEEDKIESAGLYSKNTKVDKDIEVEGAKDVMTIDDEHETEYTDDETEYTDDDSLTDADEKTEDKTLNVINASSVDVNPSKDQEEGGLLSDLRYGLFSTLNKLNPFKKKKKPRILPLYAPYCPNNFYLIYATSEAKFSYGRDGLGGWMLHVFSEVVKKTNPVCNVDLLTLTTTVCDIVAHKFQTNSTSLSGAKTAITVEHRLIKDIYFLCKTNL
ncbi:hypothetical protein KUTeg_014091 [Tegillarca granosa]|uniref:Caspase family p20 domain-containing protein n=1 Tax=Tegillarca granosa TaxID=220873 RepID=A0ABQ9EVM3_TEGGR|nr:hypothetical protein KUTeg_014091 [Tegillarca granosa]